MKSFPPRLGLYLTVVLTAAILGGTIVWSSMTLSKALSQSRSGAPASPYGTSDGVTVNGTAERIVDSDAMKWSVTISRTAKGSDASVSLEEDWKVLTDMVKAADPAATFTFQPVRTQTSSAYGYEDEPAPTSSTTISQVLVIESKNAGAVSPVTQTGTEALVKRGVRVATSAVEFYYTDMIALQQELAAKAVENAKDQAEVILEHRPDVQRIAAATYTVTPPNSGENNFTNSDRISFQKRVKASVQVTFRAD